MTTSPIPSPTTTSKPTWKDMAAYSANVSAARAELIRDLVFTGRMLLDSLPQHWHDEAIVQFRDAVNKAKQFEDRS